MVSNLAKLLLKWTHGVFSLTVRPVADWQSCRPTSAEQSRGRNVDVCRAQSPSLENLPPSECSGPCWPRKAKQLLLNKTCSNLNRDKGVNVLTAAAVVKLCSVVRSDGWSFPATISSEPLKNLSKRFWVTLFTAPSGKWMAMDLRSGEETWL